MNFIKRAFLSIQARKGKSLILFAVFLVLTNLVLVGFAIQNVTKTANDLARKELGVDVTLGLDGEKFQKYVQKQRSENMKMPEKQLAEHNNLQVGDKLKITSTDDTSTVEFEILGILVGPIENVASISKWIIYLVSITGSIILGFIIMLTIKERRKELGILLAIGEKKGKLIGQLLVEVLCIAALAFSFSIFTGGTVSQKVGDSLLQKEVISSEEEQQGAYNPGFMFEMNNDQGQDVDPIDNFDISVTSQDLLKLGGLGLLIAVLSTILPALSILRLNPKDILLKDE